MENCLVTQLKGSVNNNNLPVLNGIVITVNKKDTTDSEIRIQAVNDNIVVKTANGDAKIKCSALGYNSYTSQITVTPGQNYDILVKNDAQYNIIVSNKANIKKFIVRAGANVDGAYSLDIDKFNYIENLDELTLARCMATWDLSDFYVPSLTILSTLPNTITGNVSDFAKYPSLYYLIVSRSISGTMGDILDYVPNLESINLGEAYLITGSVEAFGEKMYSKENVKNTIQLVTLPRHISFNNAEITGAPTWTMKKVDSVVKVQDSSKNILATYDGSTWTYNG